MLRPVGVPEGHHDAVLLPEGVTRPPRGRRPRCPDHLRPCRHLGRWRPQAGKSLPGPPGKPAASDGCHRTQAHLRLGRAAPLGDRDEPAPDRLGGIGLADERKVREHPEQVTDPHLRTQRIARGEDLAPLLGKRLHAETVEDGKGIAAREGWAQGDSRVARSLLAPACPPHGHLLDRPWALRLRLR